MPVKSKAPDVNKRSYAKKAADKIVSISKGKGFSSTALQGPGFNLPDMSETIVDAVMGGTEEGSIKTVVSSKFRSVNEHPSSVKIQTELNREKIRLSQLKVKTHRDQLKADNVEITISDEHPAKVNKVIRAVGWGLTALGGIMVCSVPMIATMAIEDSGLIDLVTDNWLWGLAYGAAPVAAITAVHNLRENVQGEVSKRKLDMLVNIGAIGSFAAWAYIMPSTFLVDLKQGYGGEEQFSRVDFYRAHLLLEAFGSAAVFNAAINNLTHGAKRIEGKSDTSTRLEAKSDTLNKKITEIDTQLATIIDVDERFDNAQIAFTEQQLNKWRSVKNAVTDLKADSEAVSRADITRILSKLEKDSDDE